MVESASPAGRPKNARYINYRCVQRDVDEPYGSLFLQYGTSDVRHLFLLQPDRTWLDDIYLGKQGDPLPPALAMYWAGKRVSAPQNITDRLRTFEAPPMELGQGSSVGHSHDDNYEALQRSCHSIAPSWLEGHREPDPGFPPLQCQITTPSWTPFTPAEVPGWYIHWKKGSINAFKDYMPPSREGHSLLSRRQRRPPEPDIVLEGARWRLLEEWHGRAVSEEGHQFLPWLSEQIGRQNELEEAGHRSLSLDLSSAIQQTLLLVSIVGCTLLDWDPAFPNPVLNVAAISDSFINGTALSNTQLCELAVALGSQNNWAILIPKTQCPPLETSGELVDSFTQGWCQKIETKGHLQLIWISVVPG